MIKKIKKNNPYNIQKLSVFFIDKTAYAENKKTIFQRFVFMFPLDF